MTALGITTTITSIICMLAIIISPVQKTWLDECVISGAVVFCGVALAYHLANVSLASQQRN